MGPREEGPAGHEAQYRLLPAALRSRALAARCQLGCPRPAPSVGPRASVVPAVCSHSIPSDHLRQLCHWIVVSCDAVWGRGCPWIKRIRDDSQKKQGGGAGGGRRPGREINRRKRVRSSVGITAASEKRGRKAKSAWRRSGRAICLFVAKIRFLIGATKAIRRQKRGDESSGQSVSELGALACKRARAERRILAVVGSAGRARKHAVRSHRCGRERWAELRCTEKKVRAFFLASARAWPWPVLCEQPTGVVACGSLSSTAAFDLVGAGPKVAAIRATRVATSSAPSGQERADTSCAKAKYERLNEFTTLSPLASSLAAWSATRNSHIARGVDT